MRWGVAIAAASVVAGALGAIAAGAVAIGAFAAGAVAIKRLAVGPTRIERLELDEIVVRKITVLESDLPPGDGALLAPARSAAMRAAEPWWRS